MSKLPVGVSDHAITVGVGCTRGGAIRLPLREIETRLVPWEQIEQTHARNRPLSERPPLPKPGDRVWFRRWEWERDSGGRHVPPELATVVGIQPDDHPDFRDYVPGVGWVRDPNLWHLVRDINGKPLRGLDGGWRYEPVADPWPWLDLELEPHPAGYPRPLERAREARLRGSAGWLPLDYLDRAERRRLPGDFYNAVRPALRPLNVP